VKRHEKLHQQISDDLTVIVNSWVIKNDLKSTNQLKSMIYYHLKGIVKKQITNKAQKIKHGSLIDQLPNTTSLLHDALVRLVPPKEIFENRNQFYTSLALFVRWMLLDALKSKNAQKRIIKHNNVIELLGLDIESEPYLSFDFALSQLEKLSPRCYEIALLHYYLGFDITVITSKLNLQKSTVYNELTTAKAYIREQYQAA